MSMQVLGRGSHGLAVLMRHRSSGELLVLKEMPAGGLINQAVEAFETEARHPSAGWQLVACSL